jgi:hypothetical protein
MPDTFKNNFNVGSSIFGSDIQINEIEEVIHEPEDEVYEVSDFQD